MMTMGLVVLALAAPLAVSSPADVTPHASLRPSVHYTVTIARPHTHVLQVRMDIRGANQPTVDVSMPVWTPGSYLVREYERHVTTFAADNGEGQRLPWRKIDKNTWRVETGGGDNVIVDYAVYAREPGIRWTFLYDKGGHVLGPNLFMYAVGHADLPTTARFDMPEGWRLDGGIAPAAGDPFLISAGSYHELIDTPLLIGNFTDISFEVHGVPHLVAILGPHNADLEQLARDLRKIVEVCSEMFGGLPYERYAFVFTSLTGGGGIEHANGTTIGFGNVDWRDRRIGRAILGTSAHEFFHAWNVKRIQPSAFRPYNYEEENYTDALWVYEGFTSYYGDRILYRAGLIESLGDPVDAIAMYRSTPGYRNQSPADASFNAWIHLYRGDESTDNYRANYYFAGAVLANLLELEIASRTGGAKGLDDVMRLMWVRARDQGATFDSEAVRAVCEEVAGGSFREFFDAYVFGTEPIRFEDFFRLAGYELAVNQRATRDRNRAGYAGVQTRASNGRVQVVRVERNSPAWHAGLNYGDEVVSVGGNEVTSAASFARALRRYGPGRPVEFVVSRFGERRVVAVRLGEPPVPVYQLVEMEDPTETQLAVRRRWRQPGGRR
jgi:predicted metalloprotease with PDZ domain